MRNNSKQNKKKVLKIATAALVSILFCILIFMLATNLSARKSQLGSLNSASDDLYQLYIKFLDDPAVHQDTASYVKKCFQASAKLSKGTITCGPRGGFKRSISYSSAKLDSGIEEYIKQDAAFSKVISDEFSKGEQNAWSIIEFINTGTSIKCFISYTPEGDLTDYTLGCNQTVPGFLPGYIVE